MKLKDFAVLGAGILVLAICVYGLGRNAFLAQADEVLTPPPAGESGSALTGIQEDHLLSVTDAPPAPALAAGTWINSPSLKLSELHGKVVLVEFWTFACYNCRNTLPSVKSWDKRYRDSGLITIGVHTPEMKSERDLANVRHETERLGIRYPVVTDNDYRTWRAYDIEAWPTILILDKQGRVRWKHVGEGSYDETEGVIRKLLGETVAAVEQKTTITPAKSAAEAEPEQITRTDEEWRQILTPEQYYITREHGTEAPFSGAYYDNHEKGTYLCVACGLPLFSSETKFDSGTGWPSFYQPISARNIKEFTDQSLGMERTEVVCRRCGAHLGHVFDDGPPPTHLRYCLNSVALKFVKGS